MASVQILDLTHEIHESPWKRVGSRSVLYSARRAHTGSKPGFYSSAPNISSCTSTLSAGIVKFNKIYNDMNLIFLVYLNHSYRYGCTMKKDFHALFTRLAASISYFFRKALFANSQIMFIYKLYGQSSSNKIKAINFYFWHHFIMTLARIFIMKNILTRNRKINKINVERRVA